MGKIEMFFQPALVVFLALVTHPIVRAIVDPTGWQMLPVKGQHYNDGCEISDNVAYKSTSILDLIPNISNVFQCSTVCRSHKGCSYWTLHKSGTYGGWCHLLGDVEHKLDTQGALSGTAECGDITNTTMSQICEDLANITAEHCNNDPQNITEQYDEEHCKSLLDHFDVFCVDASTTTSTTTTTTSTTTSTAGVAPELSSCICAKYDDGTEKCKCKKHN